MQKLKIAIYYIVLMLFVMGVCASCGSAYGRKIKHSNIADIIQLLETHYPVAPDSRVEIPFYYHEPGSTLGDPTLYDYSAARATALGRYNVSTDVAQQIADFCRKYRIGEITMRFEPTPNGIANLVKLLKKQAQGFPF